MGDFVDLFLKRNRGWPWPEESLGLTPLYGERGWCRTCGVPYAPQTGQLMLQRRNLTPHGAWVPNWLFDTICVDATVARSVANFNVELREVGWPRNPPGDVMQIIVPTIGRRWFDEDELREKAIDHYGQDGAACLACGVWRWMPLGFGKLPPLRITPSFEDDVDIAASPEWFGVGLKAFRQIVVRRELAETLVAASPGDFSIAEIG